MVYRLSTSGIDGISIVYELYRWCIDWLLAHIDGISMGQKIDYHKPSVHNRLLIPSLKLVPNPLAGYRPNLNGALWRNAIDIAPLLLP